LSGTDPENIFPERSRIERLDNNPKLEGTLLVRLFPERNKSFKLLIPPSDPGITPDIEQELKSSSCSVLSFSPNKSGIDPLSMNPEALKDSNRVKF
jgi:hypothetical protein